MHFLHTCTCIQIYSNVCILNSKLGNLLVLFYVFPTILTYSSNLKFFNNKKIKIKDHGYIFTYVYSESSVYNFLHFEKIWDTCMGHIF